MSSVNGLRSFAGVLAYNVIGQMQGWRTDFIGAMYRTLKEIFPQVYTFPAESSMNVVIVATKSPRAARFRKQA